MTLPKVIEDIHALNEELQAFEKKYGMLSEDFFKLYETGQMRDEEPAEIINFGRWAAFYETKVHRLDLYRQLFDQKAPAPREPELQPA